MLLRGFSALWLVLLAWLGSCYLTLASPQLSFSTFSTGSFNVKVCSVILQKAYQQLGFDIDFLEVPGQRALELANSGISDGEVFRVAQLETQYPNLVMIPVVIGRGTETVFVKQLNFDFQGWESLRPYVIGIQIGAKGVERGTQGMKTVSVNEFRQLFEMLDAGRVDVVIATYLEGMNLIRQMHFQDIRALESSQIQQNFYHYLHRKHQALVPQITKVLKQMEAKGQLQEIKHTIEQQLLIP